MEKKNRLERKKDDYYFYHCYWFFYHFSDTYAFTALGHNLRQFCVLFKKTKYVITIFYTSKSVWKLNFHGCIPP